MLIGVAVGDCLGHSTEWQFDPYFTSMRSLERFSIIFARGGSRVGRISDDTQTDLLDCRTIAEQSANFSLMIWCTALWIASQRIVGRGKNTAASLLRGTSNDCRSARHTMDVLCGRSEMVEGRGNGGLMRFSPIVLPHLRSPSCDCSTAMTRCWPHLITHGNSMGSWHRSYR